MQNSQFQRIISSIFKALILWGNNRNDIPTVIHDVCVYTILYAIYL